MAEERAEVPPRTPPSPIVALLAAFMGLTLLVVAWTAEGPAAVASLAGATVAFVAAAFFYRDYVRRQEAFDRHIGDSDG